MSPKREPEPEFVDLEHAPSAPIARMLVEMLRDEGIAAYVDGTYLQDEWAITQILLKQVNITVQVPRADHDRARRILDEARASGRLLEEDPPPPDVE